MEVGTFKCERYDCPKPKGTDCSHCGMPVVARGDAPLVNLFYRCKTYNILPVSGSLMEQPNEVMEIFDVFNSVIEEQRAKQIEEQKSNAEKERMKRELR